MDGSERHYHVEERAYRILRDDRAVTAYARFVDAQLRYCEARGVRGIRSVLAWLRALAHVDMVMAVDDQARR